MADLLLGGNPAMDSGVMSYLAHMQTLPMIKDNKLVKSVFLLREAENSFSNSLIIHPV